MPIKTLQLRHSFQAELSRVYDYLLDFKKFSDMHPFMVEVRELSQPAANSTEYEVKEETVLLGFIRMKPVYCAEVIEIERFKHIRYVSNVKGGIVLTINFTFEEDPIKTRVTILEKIEVRGNFLLASYFLGILKKAHLQLFENLSDSLKKQNA